MSGASRALLVVLCVQCWPQPALADDKPFEDLTWVEQKCVLYQRAWDWAFDSIGPSGISAGFIAQNQRFIAAGCTENIAVCPVSDEDFELANLLTVMTMNEGMASTFVPFQCPDAAD